MQLSFHAREGHVCHWPGLRVTGRVHNYVGRELVKGEHRACKRPVEIDSDTPEGRRLAKFCRRGSLLPADEATAKFCGVPFKKLDLVGGEWVEKKGK